MQYFLVFPLQSCGPSKPAIKFLPVSERNSHSEQTFNFSNKKFSTFCVVIVASRKGLAFVERFVIATNIDRVNAFSRLGVELKGGS
jgi:hypothetical protein